ncbi:hypothetical protein T03_2078, partial [Trichinella britovi]
MKKKLQNTSEWIDNYEDGAVITSLDFAHNLQFYETPPSVNMDYRRAVDLAIQRHQVEMAGP